MKLLCTGDIHIGRRPSRLPEHVDCRELSCAKSWTTIVERAIAERVDLVVVSGDIVDRDNRYYEAVGPFEQGVRHLARAGIKTAAVAGNHDYDTLRWVAEGLPAEDFSVLGLGGTWQRLTIERDGAQALHLDGWSIPTAHHSDDPLREYRAGSSDGVPVLGVLHADLEQPNSPYAPVRLADLRRQPVGFWLLGHVHGPELHAQEGFPSVLYPGSPQAMDPGETGAHGAWLVEVNGTRTFTARPVPLSRVRYETITFDVSGLTEEGALHARLTDAVRTGLREVVGSDCGPLRYLSYRVRIAGETSLHRLIESRVGTIAPELEFTLEGVTAVVERVEVATRPPRQIEELARGRDAPAVLARLISALERDELDEDQKRLLDKLVRQVGELRGAAPYRSLDDPYEEQTALGEISSVLGAQSSLLLDVLLAQKEVAA